MNKHAFNARARTGRKLARIGRQDLNAWLYDQAKEYARTGYVGPDLMGWLDWYWFGYDEPQVALGSLREAYRRGWDRRVDQVWKEVQQGLHDSSRGLRPVHVYRGEDGHVRVVYPDDARERTISWEQAVA
jgi:hypothetical protein